ncbi:MAG: helix-turn-helix domain-containing protein [Acetobacterium sp.]
MSVFSENLKYLRKKMKISQVNFAKELEISPSAVTMYEQGKREPNFELLRRMAVFYKVDYNQLLGEVYPTGESDEVIITSEKKKDYIKEDFSSYEVCNSKEQLMEIFQDNPSLIEVLEIFKKIDQKEIEALIKMGKGIK